MNKSKIVYKIMENIIIYSHTIIMSCSEGTEATPVRQFTPQLSSESEGEPPPLQVSNRV